VQCLDSSAATARRQGAGERLPTEGAPGPITRVHLTADASRPANGYVPFHDAQGQIVYLHGYFRPDITYVQPAD
jgi:hypothetical protein